MYDGGKEKFWTSNETTTLINNWPIKSGSQIAALLRRTRNSVAGKTKRLQDKGVLPALTAKHYAEKPTQARPARPPRPRHRKREPEIVEFKTLNKLLAETAPAPLNGRPCQLAELTDRRCHWPIGDPRDADFYYCGARKLSDVPYCTHHIRIAYNRSGDGS